jgi:hypothetical protein
MNDETIQRMIDDVYDESKEGSLRQMMKDFYNRRMTGVIVMTWSFGIVSMALAIWCLVAFFEAETTKDQIMYATGFLMFNMWVGGLKIFAWQMIHRNSLKREIKRLELRIAQLADKRTS